MPGTNRTVLARVLAVAVVVLLVAVVMVGTRPVWNQTSEYVVTTHITPRDAGNLSIGVSVDTDRIDFGRIPVHAINARKTIRIANNEQRPLQLRILTAGNISDHLTVSDQRFTVPPGDHHNVTIKLQTAQDTEPGRYAGHVVVEERLPWWRWQWR